MSMLIIIVKKSDANPCRWYILKMFANDSVSLKVKVTIKGVLK